MPLNTHEASVGVFVRCLTSLKTLLTKGEAHASTTGLDPRELLDTQLAPEMYNLGTQAHWVGEGAKLAVKRLIGEPIAPLADDAKSFAEIQRRTDATIAYLGTLSPEALEAGLERVIEIEHRGKPMRFVGGQFLLQFAIPNVHFHLAAAYNILRHKGVPIGKGDYMGPLG